MTAHKLALWAALALMCISAGCGGGGAQSIASALPQVHAVPVQPLLDLPAPSQLRQAAYSEATISQDGSQFGPAPQFPANKVTVSGTKGLFDPTWAPGLPGDPSGLAYGCYTFVADNFDRDPTIRFTWGTAHDISLFYVAVSNYAHDRWDFYAGPQGGILTLTQQSFTDGLDPATHTMLVIPIIMGTDQWALNNVRLGDVPAPVITGVTPLNGLVGATVTMSGQLSPDSGPVALWQWNFAGGATPNTINVATPQITLGAAGSYNCTVRGTNSAGQVTYHFTLNVTAPPPAPDITAVSPIQGQPDAMLTLNPTNGGGAVDTWSWDFGTGATPATSTDPSPQIQLAATPGVYPSSVTATNITGSSTFNFDLTVGDTPPHVIAVNPRTGPEGVLLNLTCFNNGGPVTDFAWDFGGGATPNTSTDEHPQITLGTKGQYNCNVTVSNSGGSDSFNFVLDVLPPPGSCNVTAVSPTSGGEGQLVTFVPTFTGSVDSWVWSFGAAATPDTAFDEQPQVTLGAAGTYNCSVTATNAVNSSQYDFQITIVSASDPPLITAVSPLTGDQFDNFFINATYLGQVDSWAWVFTGALPDTSTQPSPHIFLSSGPGTYDCSVTATNVNGSTQFNFQLVIGGGPPPP